MVLDNADDPETFFGRRTHAEASGAQEQTPLYNYIPKTPNRFILVTTQNKRVGMDLAYQEEPISVPPLGRSDATRLLEFKL
jgi:hypothetical protein